MKFSFQDSWLVISGVNAIDIANMLLMNDDAIFVAFAADAKQVHKCTSTFS